MSNPEVRKVYLQRPSLGSEEGAAVGRVLESRWLGMGPRTMEFEERVREFLGAGNVIAVNSGTSALHIALDSIGIGPGDEVIVPSLTFVASIQAIANLGAEPVFCDVERNTLNLNLDDLVAKITFRTRAIMPVHYGGVPCDMDKLLQIADEKKLRVIEDAAHAFGSKYKGRMVGSFGDITCFSFDPIKNITCGEGGAVVTNNAEIAEIIRVKRMLGIDNDTWTRYEGRRNYMYEVRTNGYRYHMSDMNAAVGLVQLEKAGIFKARKQNIVARYDDFFKDIAELRLLDRGLPEVFPFFYVVRVLGGRRDELIADLNSKGILTGVHYIPNHLQPYFEKFAVPISLPETEKAFNEILTLPLYVEMSDDDVEYVIRSVGDFFNK